MAGAEATLSAQRMTARPAHHPRTASWQLAAAGAALVAGIALWLVALPSIDTASLGDHGLLGELPATWYAALALLVGGGVASMVLGPCRPWLFAGFVGAVVAVLYATVPAVADAPQYPWVYKHIGVTQLISAHGGIDANVDIYNRWPGFFALAAMFSRLAGLPDPVSYAAWAEPLFMAVDALLVAAIAHAVTRRVRVSAAAALLFVLFNWVGQTYFSPQAAASTLALALTLVVLRGLASRSRFERPGEPAPAIALGWSPRAAIAVVLVLDLAIVVTHQLTPFAIVAQVAVLTLLGAVRSWRMAAALAVLPLLFLLANLNYLHEHFTLLTSLDPFENLRSAGTYDVARSPGKVFNADVSMLLSGGMFVGALLGGRALRRSGFGLMPLMLLGLAFAPFAVVLLQSYGGEASLRIILYAAPWAAILVAAGVATVRDVRRRAAVALAVAGAACTLTVPAFYGVSQLNVIPRSTVDVSEAFYRDAPRGSVLMLAGPGFPLRVGARYDAFRGPVGDADPNLLKGSRLRSRPLGPADLPAVIRSIRRYSTRGYLAFSDTEVAWARTFGLTPPGALSDLEHAVAASPAFRLWTRSDTARIYELVNPRPAA